MKWLFDIIKAKAETGFTGSVQINFFNGGISNININESVKPPLNKKSRKITFRAGICDEVKY